MKLNIIKNTMLLCSFAVICSCATNKNQENTKSNPNTSDASKLATSIVKQPFKDLGFMKPKVSDSLTQITDPYALPDGADCNWLNYQISELDKVLGEESSKSSNIDDTKFSKKGSNEAKQFATSAVTSAATSWIPARGLVRKLSGADKAEKKLNDAVERGKVRRGYLRGVAYAMKCDAKK